MDKKRALAFLYLFGLISFLGDIIYEGARSISGQYLGTLGASAVVVGVVAGVGELLGYLARLLAGTLSDRINSYWMFVFLGYGFLVAIPLLSTTDSWLFASILFILERIGKGVRSPAKDALLSEPAKKVGTGYGFGLLELIDQLGALIGPLLLFVIFLKVNGTLSKEDYQLSLSFFWAPFILLMLTLTFTYLKFRQEHLKNTGYTKKLNTSPGKKFWFFCIFVFFTTAGFVSFSLIGYHLKVSNAFSELYIVAMYTLVMAIDGLMAVPVGKVYDRVKLKMLYPVPVLTFIAVVLSFTADIIYVIVGMALWGAVLAIHETVFKAYIVDTVEFNRASAFAVFNTVYGVGILAGNVAASFIYQNSPELLAVYLFVVQLLAMFSLIKTRTT